MHKISKKPAMSAWKCSSDETPIWRRLVVSGSVEWKLMTNWSAKVRFLFCDVRNVIYDGVPLVTFLFPPLPVLPVARWADFRSHGPRPTSTATSSANRDDGTRTAVHTSETNSRMRNAANVRVWSHPYDVGHDIRCNLAPESVEARINKIPIYTETVDL
jgi:hypothetical protein